MASAEEKESLPSEEKSNDEDEAKSVDSFQKEASSLVDNMSADSPGLQSKSKKPDWAHNNTMLSVKDERKRAEYDVQLLANRLAYLRSEEKAAAKRMADTKQRAKDIEEAKQKSKRHDSARQEWKASMKQREEANREYFRAQREERQKKLKSTREAMIETKKEQASILRQKSQSSSHLKLRSGQLNMENESERKRAESYEAIKNTHRIQKEKELKRRQEREIQLKKQVEAKVKEECRRKEEAEKLIAQFEAEEAVLIQRLRDTQIAHHGALSDLEKTLLSP